MKRLLLLSILYPSLAYGDGCFVKSGETQCSTTPVICSQNIAENFRQYGNVIGQACALVLFPLNRAEIELAVEQEKVAVRNRIIRRLRGRAQRCQR